MQQAEVLAAKIQSDARFELWGTPTTGVVVWRPRHLPAGVVRDQLNDAWVSLTDIDGEVWLRSVAANLSADASLVFAKVCAALETATSE